MFAMIARAIGAMFKPRAAAAVAKPVAAAAAIAPPVAIASTAAPLVVAIAVVATSTEGCAELPTTNLIAEERPLIAAIGAHATAAAGLVQRHEAEDFRLASRLRSVAKLNRPTPASSIATPGRVSIIASRSDSLSRSSAVKRVRPGLLPPLAARGHAPVALAA